MQVFGRGSAGAPRTPRGNYIWFRGGTIRFGKLTMSDADLQLIDMHPADPFDFFSAKYSTQLVAGYSKNTPQQGLRTYMPDYAGREVDPHSCISVRAGSIRAARRAGRYADSIATVNSTIVTIRYVWDRMR